MKTEVFTALLRTILFVLAAILFELWGNRATSVAFAVLAVLYFALANILQVFTRAGKT